MAIKDLVRRDGSKPALAKGLVESTWNRTLSVIFRNMPSDSDAMGFEPDFEKFFTVGCW